MLKQMFNSKRARNVVALTVIFDIFLFLIVLIPDVILELGVVEPFRRGFFCNDLDILYPVRQPPITPSQLLIFLISLLLPMLLVIKTQLLVFTVERTDAQKRQAIGIAYRQVVAVGVGMVLTRFFTNVIKHYAGRLRPFFYAMCQPHWNSSSCHDVNGQPLYITDYVCTGSTSDDMRTSFPSVHTSTAAFGMFYIVFYLHLYWNRPCAQVLRFFLQSMALLFVVYIGTTRVADNAHHYDDILAGILIGSGTAYIAVLCSDDPFAECTTDSQYEELEGSIQPGQPIELAASRFEDQKLH